MLLALSNGMNSFLQFCTVLISVRIGDNMDCYQMDCEFSGQ